MRKILFLLVFCFAATAVQAQTMNIHKKDGSVVKIAIKDIDHIEYGNATQSTSSKSSTPAPAPAPKRETKQEVQITATPTSMTTYRGKTGNIYSFRITGKNSGRIWGGDGKVYTDDSELATAAVHAGVLRNGETGVVTVMIVDGRSNFPSITRNGVTSIKYGQWPGCFKFIDR